MLDKNTTPVVLALGYFDSVHKGHQKVIETAKKYAENHGAKTIVYTFRGNLKSVLGNGNEKVVYTDREREKIYFELGADGADFAPLDAQFLSTEKKEFLDLINKKYNVIAYACGSDYRFGKSGNGTTDYLIEYAKEKGQEVIVCDILTDGGEKISSTLIKKLLSEGEVDRANKLLGRAYSVSGVVVRDRQIGKTLGFPTLNVKLDSQKERLLDGVYSGFSVVDGIKYLAIINYGARPTFNLNEKLVEAHLIGFNGNLYGEEVVVHFNEFIRGVKKFDSEKQLIEQITQDLKFVKGRNYD